ncbi:MAG: hypothetical protein ACYDAO_06210 [Thermoplasmataceae archaeon]
MKIFTYKKSKEKITNFYRTVYGQFCKDITNLWRSGYIFAIYFLMILTLIYFLHEGYQVNSTGSSTWALKESLEGNIVTLGFSPIFYSGFAWVFIIIPAVNITDDIENKNFELLKSYNFNSFGYFIGKLLSSLFYISLLLLIIGYISEGTAFYDGYLITSKFLIAPFFVALVFIPTLIIGIGFAMFISAIMSNKVLSIMFIFIFSIFINFLDTSLNFLVNGNNISLFNAILFSFNSTYSVVVSYKMLGLNIFGGTVTLPPRDLISAILIGSIIFFISSYLVIFLRRRSTDIIEKILSIKSYLVNK